MNNYLKFPIYMYLVSLAYLSELNKTDKEQTDSEIFNITTENYDTTEMEDEQTTADFTDIFNATLKSFEDKDVTTMKEEDTVAESTTMKEEYTVNSTYEETTDIIVTARVWEPVDITTEESKYDTEMKQNETDAMDVYCKHFKCGRDFDYNDMADIWQVVYYQLPDKVSCFKIHLKKTTDEEKSHYAQKYGNFNESINWDLCNIEISSSGQMERTHFLQGNNDNKGVMRNMVILEENGDTNATLREESPDQWRVVENLLLMRDCDTGGLVIFGKVPLQPRREDIMDALKLFGEEGNNGKTCEDETL